MDLLGYITNGIAKTGGVIALAEKLGVSRTHLADAKAMRRGLPTFACVRLAQLIDKDERCVIAASELVTEKNPERRAVWLPFVQEIAQTVLTKTAERTYNSTL